MPKTGENRISMTTVYRFTQDLVCRTIPRVEFTSNNFFFNFVYFTDQNVVLEMTKMGESTDKMPKRGKAPIKCQKRGPEIGLKCILTNCASIGEPIFDQSRICGGGGGGYS